MRPLRGFGGGQAQRVVGRRRRRRAVTAAAVQQAAHVDQHGVGRHGHRHDAALAPEQHAVRPAQDAVAPARVLERLRGVLGVIRCLPLSRSCIRCECNDAQRDSLVLGGANTSNTILLTHDAIGLRTRRQFNAVDDQDAARIVVKSTG